MIDDQILEEICTNLTKSIREADDLLDQAALVQEWSEWLHMHRNHEILFVPKFNENNQ